MSLASLLLAFAPALAARFKPLEELEHENKRLKDELAGVMSELETIRNTLKRVLVERDAERERASLWRGEALRLRHDDLLPMPIGGQHAAVQQMQQYAQNALAQQQQQMAMMQAPNAQAYGQGLQELQQANWPHCDCSPSRSAALFALVPGA